MKQFNVTIYHEIRRIEAIEVTIEAKSESAAEEKAQTVLQSGGYDYKEWSLSADDEDSYVYDVEEVFEDE